MNFNLDYEMFSASTKNPRTGPTENPYSRNYYWSKEEIEMGKIKEPIMAKPTLIIEKHKMKPLIAEATQINSGNIIAVRKWAVGSKLHGYDGSPSSRHLVLAGGQIARQGDYVVKQIDGRFMAFKPETFKAISSFVGFAAKYGEA